MFYQNVLEYIGGQRGAEEGTIYFFAGVQWVHSADATENGVVTVSIVRKIGSSMTGLIKFQSVKDPKSVIAFDLALFSHDADGSHYKNPPLSWRP